MERDNSRIASNGRRDFIRDIATIGAGSLMLTAAGVATAAEAGQSAPRNQAPIDWPWSRSLAAKPTDIPPPITRSHAITHNIVLRALDIDGKLDDGSIFQFMTWEGQVPGPFIRVRQDDTINLSVINSAKNLVPHNVDFHAAYGTGGGAVATLAVPGQTKKLRFKCVYPGAFIYHCAVPDMDHHISRGMFGMILVEPHDGMPKVDREFYLGQHEIYTRQPFGSSGRLDFDTDSMIREQPQFVLFNGAVRGFTQGRLGPMKAKVGETVRVFMVCGGPNLASSFHPIGNVWERCWPDGAVTDPPRRFVQTQLVPPGSCFIGELKLPVAETIHLVDHALSRVVHQGLMADILVEGASDPALFSPLPD